MIYLFIGFFFIFIDWQISLGVGTLDVCPNLIGYALILIGAKGLREESRRFDRVHITAWCLLGVSALQLVLSLLGILSEGIISAVISVAVTIAFLYLTREISSGAKEMEARRNRPIGAGKLETAWGFLCVGSLLMYAPLLLPSIYLTCVMLQILSYIWFEYSVYVIYSKTK